LSSDLAENIGQFYADPLGFVLFVYPWGQKDTILADFDGPDDWQVAVLKDIRDHLLSGKPYESLGALLEAVASGHGVGKTALVSWIIQWFISTRPHPQIVVTANTETQLSTKTWRELSKWHKLLINKEWFTWTATKFYQSDNPETWFASAIPWSVDRAEAFAGTHERDVLMIFDEASAIPDPIWETAEGAMTTPGAIWIAFGNPTKNTGRFRECWGKFKHRWKTYQVDSRTAKMAEKEQIDRWVADYGEDSDFVRVRVRGVFPRAGNMQFIGQDIVDAAVRYKAEGYENFPKILGVDVARHGEAQTVLQVRQGRKAFPSSKYRGLNTMDVASRVSEKINEEDPDYVFVDGAGVGGGVVDRLRQLGHRNIIEVNGGGSPNDKGRYRFARDEWWGNTKDWLKGGAEIPSDNELLYDLTGPEYSFTAHGQLAIEPKDSMKKRGLASPDCADALTMTFAHGSILPKREKPRERYGKKRLRMETTWMAR